MEKHTIYRVISSKPLHIYSLANAVMATACIPMYFAAKKKKKWLILPFLVFYGLGTPTNVGVAGWLIFGEGDMATKQWVWAFLLMTG